MDIDTFFETHIIKKFVQGSTDVGLIGHKGKLSLSQSDKLVDLDVDHYLVINTETNDAQVYDMDSCIHSESEFIKRLIKDYNLKI